MELVLLSAIHGCLMLSVVAEFKVVSFDVMGYTNTGSLAFFQEKMMCSMQLVCDVHMNN